MSNNTVQYICNIVLALLLFVPINVVAGDKPLLSEAIAQAIDSKGIDSATREFASNYERDKDRYTIDMMGISQLTQRYAREQNTAAAQAVMQIAAPYMTMFTTGMQNAYSGEMARRRAEMEKMEKARRESRQQEKQRHQQEVKQKERFAKLEAAKKPKAKPLIDLNVAYSAINILKATNPNGSKFNSELYVNHAPGKTRYENKKKLHEPIRIYRYDKGIVWAVHREKKQYKGVKLYQEFKLTSGMGLGSHTDNLMLMRRALLSPKGLKNMGKETVNGYSTTHYYKRQNNQYDDGYNDYNYWISDQGILVKMEVATPGVIGYSIENRNIKLASQSDDLFVPPPDYKKGGDVISWRKEKLKLDASK